MECDYFGMHMNLRQYKPVQTIHELLLLTDRYG